MLSQIGTIPDIKALKKDVVKLFENLYKYDDGANFFDDQHQGPVSATSSVILGDKILGLARFFLGIGILGNSKDLYHQIDALDCLDQNRQTCAGAVVLTDLVFWCLLLPFQSVDGFKLTLLIGCMHSLNVVFLLLDSALNNLFERLLQVALSLPGNCYSMGSHVVLWHRFSSPPMLRTICLACESESIEAVKNVSASIYSPTCGFRLQSTKEKDHTKGVFPGISRRADLWLGTVLMNKGARVNTKRWVGPVPGVDIGNVFFF
ncbi:unnamed protein product [Lactuca saligna]|uniref:Uncharacterized protein n=1 Tax=Lactuca saligna TaxID=75948 RepID=A0AA35ZCQ7_LACSI|nr:unnamed protein product [Lactuca saligna]